LQPAPRAHQVVGAVEQRGRPTCSSDYDNAAALRGRSNSSLRSKYEAGDTMFTSLDLAPFDSAPASAAATREQK